MTDHIGEATKKVIDLDALCERLKDQYGDPETGGFEYTNPDGPAAAATIKALIAELRDARSTIEELLYAHTDKSIAMGQAFLARNGKGEG